jgi:predicted Zn-dependent protease
VRLARVGRRVLKAASDCSADCYFGLLGSAKPNAFSLPEGGVYITAGLYSQLRTDDLLAAAIAHEVSHVAVGDGWRRASSTQEQFQRELAADRRAVTYLASAGFNPRSLVELMEITRHEQRSGWADTRISALNRQLGPVPVQVAKETWQE